MTRGSDSCCQMVGVSRHAQGRECTWSPAISMSAPGLQGTNQAASRRRRLNPIIPDSEPGQTTALPLSGRGHQSNAFPPSKKNPTKYLNFIDVDWKSHPTTIARSRSRKYARHAYLFRTTPFELSSASPLAPWSAHRPCPLSQESPTAPRGSETKPTGWWSANKLYNRPILSPRNKCPSSRRPSRSS